MKTIGMGSESGPAATGVVQAASLECAEPVVVFARHLVVALREGLDEDVRQRARRRLAQAAIELAVQFPVAQGLAARAALEARGEIARIEPADEVEEGREHGAHQCVIVRACAGEGVAQPGAPRRSGGCRAP